MGVTVVDTLGKSISVRKSGSAGFRSGGGVSIKKSDVPKGATKSQVITALKGELKEQDRLRSIAKRFQESGRKRFEGSLEDFKRITGTRLTTSQARRVGLKDSTKPKQKTQQSKTREIIREKVEVKPEPKKIKPSGTLLPATKPKTLLEKLRQKELKTLYKIEKSKGAKENKAIAKRILSGIFVLGSIGAVKGVAGFGEAVKNPKEFIKNLASSVKQPKKTIKTIGHEFTVNPVGTIAEFYTFAKTTGMAGKGVKRSPVGRYVTEELYIRTQPKEIQKAVRSILKSSKVQEKINPINVRSIKKVDFASPKLINRLEAKVLDKTVKQTDSVIFGSLAGKTLSKGKKLPTPKDIDLATKDINLFNKKFMDNLPKSQKKNYQIKGQKIIRKSDGQGILDVKPIDRLIPQKSILTRRGYLPVSGYVKVVKAPKGSVLPRISKKVGISRLEVPTQKHQKVDGVKLVGFGEQTTRKGLGTIQVLVEKNIKRAKDPQSFIASLEVQLDYLKKGKRNIINNRRINKIESALKVLKSKKFADLLDKKVKGLTKEYPILKKIDAKKLKEIEKATIERKVKQFKEKARRLNELSKKDKLSNKEIKEVKQLRKVVKEESSLLPSRLQRSILPSRFPTSRLSQSKIPPSRLGSSVPSRSSIPSKLPKKPSKIPPSKIPKSKIPSRVPLSKVPKSKIPPSRIPPSKIPKYSKIPRLPPSKLPPIIRTTAKPPIPKNLNDLIEAKIKKLSKKKKKKIVYEYTPTLAGLDMKATRTTGQFSGFETRGNVIRLLPVKVRKYKKKVGRRRVNVRKHRRSKPRR